MRAVPRALILGACAAVVGCFPPAPGVSGRGAVGGGVVVVPQAQGSAGDTGSAPGAQGAQDEDESALGTVRLTIVWPRRTAAIPLSANSIHIRITDGGGDLKAEKIVSRPADGQSQQVAVRLKAASNLSVGVKAYAREATSAEELTGEIPLAQGNASINVTRSQIANAKIVLVPLWAPAVSGFESNTGKVGDTVVVKGSNLSGPDLVVLFNGATASAPVQVSSESISVKVPETATVGPVRVIVDGIPSESDTVFWVVKSLSITAKKHDWDTTGEATRLVLATKTLQFTAARAFALAPGAGSPDPEGAPEILWNSSKITAGTIDVTTGLYTAADNSETSRVLAKLGTVTSAGIDVTGVVVSGVALTPSAATLNLPTPVGYVSAGFPTTVKLTAQASFSPAGARGGINWKSSDGGTATVDAEGLVTAVSPGVAIVSATSVDDPRVLATASIRVDDSGLADLVIN